MRDDEPLYRVQATCTAESGKAILIDVDDGTPQWIPRSQICDGENEVDCKDKTGEFVCSLWIAKQKGWA
jgi:hypothetical protein